MTIKIGLERLDTQEGITVEALLDSGATVLVMSSEFAKKKGFKLKKLERPIQVRNVDGTFNREGPIENTVEVNVYYKGHVERTEIDVIGGQKWGVILEMPWLERHNPEIDWKTGEVKMTRCPEECERQWRLVQCCGNHLSQGQMITQGVNLFSGSIKWEISQENSTRSLCLISVLFIQKVHGPCYQ